MQRSAAVHLLFLYQDFPVGFNYMVSQSGILSNRQSMQQNIKTPNYKGIPFSTIR